MILGAHEGVAGGVSTAFARAEADGADCLQIFTRNVRGWAARPFEPAEVERFRAEARRTKLPVAAHSTYLVNLCAADAALREKSWEALADELGRCQQLGVRWLVFHPGTHADAAEGIRLAGEGMVHALEKVPGKARLLVETTARQGSSLVWNFEQVAASRAARHEHIGEGETGLAAFRRLVNDPRFADVPAFLETELRFKENLAVLRSLKR